ncbi:pancreatic triacylglycerol lipase-like [Toxorhynchites rutilus septentrionalis]|uniref:pancreatic triacylglycerol lipase-like n=1 Tax=Toxorhynchites rutilus septentrionalis TaxID=329112 RepID=UPI002479959B|nr:pancreatic triacylglycerol lipase-like [Toxorhynchites rutilus septentrionalis]
MWFVFYVLVSIFMNIKVASRQSTEVKLFFYTPDFPQGIDISSHGSLSQYKPQKVLKVLIHGWNADRNQIAMVPVRNAYAVQNEHNILLADWANASSTSYGQERQMVRFLGFEIGSILSEFMQRMSIEHGQVHVIGHSLGAHIAGNVGKFFQGKLGRITALDPAGPLFARLSIDAVRESDAKFVDAIHTDGLALGELTARAHADFYPNRGIPPQPGCQLLDVVSLNACSHYRSTGFFAESILLPNNFIAYGCAFEDIFDSTEPCKHVESGAKKMVAMGEFVPQKARGTFYLRTSNLPPYGLGNSTMKTNGYNTAIISIQTRACQFSNILTLNRAMGLRVCDAFLTLM